MWRNDTKCKYMFMFPLKNLARKRLRYQSPSCVWNLHIRNHGHNPQLTSLTKCDPGADLIKLPSFQYRNSHCVNCQHWKRNVVILMKFSSLAALKVVILTTFSAASDENFVKMLTFLFQWITQSYDHFISTIRFPILVRHLYIESGPRPECIKSSLHGISPPCCCVHGAPITTRSEPWNWGS